MLATRMVLILLLRLIAYLPLPVLHSMGRFVGLLVYLWPGNYRHNLRVNAAQAGYGKGRFARQAAAETGAMIFEMPKVWFQPERALARLSDADHPVHGVVARAHAEKHGIIFLTPHLGCFEIMAHYQACRMTQLTPHHSPWAPLTVMFRLPRRRALTPLLEHVRNTSKLRAVPADIRGVREFVRVLRNGASIGMLPDQVPAKGDGVWVPFFGRMAYTVTLPGKLAALKNVPIILSVAERLPWGRGWRAHYLRIPNPLPADAHAQAAIINAAMESMIHRFPQQYLWSYNRYKGLHKAPPAPPTSPSCEP